MKHLSTRARLAAALALVLIAFVLLSCDGPPNADGSCIAPSPCQSAQGGNP